MASNILSKVYTTCITLALFYSFILISPSTMESIIEQKPEVSFDIYKPSDIHTQADQFNETIKQTRPVSILSLIIPILIVLFFTKDITTRFNRYLATSGGMARGHVQAQKPIPMHS